MNKDYLSHVYFYLIKIILTSGAIQSTRPTWFTLLFGLKSPILALSGLEAKVLASPSLDTNIFASACGPKFWPRPRKYSN